MLALVLLPFAGLWLHGRIVRGRIERQAASVASVIAGRPVRVRCPGPLRRHLMEETTDGSVQFGADGRPSDSTTLSDRTCDGLAAARAHGGRWTLDCLPACPEQQRSAAWALATLAHESVHLQGQMNEGATECEARTYIRFVARRYGLSDHATDNLAAWMAGEHLQELPPLYQTC